MICDCLDENCSCKNFTSDDYTSPNTQPFFTINIDYSYSSQCPSCGCLFYQWGYNYCPYCGCPLEKRCPHCGKMYE